MSLRLVEQLLATCHAKTETRLGEDHSPSGWSPSEETPEFEKLAQQFGVLYHIPNETRGGYSRSGDYPPNAIGPMFSGGEPKPPYVANRYGKGINGGAFVTRGKRLSQEQIDALELALDED